MMVYEKYVNARELGKESSVSLIFVDPIMVDEKCVDIWETDLNHQIPLSSSTLSWSTRNVSSYGKLNEIIRFLYLRQPYHGRREMCQDMGN